MTEQEARAILQAIKPILRSLPPEDQEDLSQHVLMELLQEGETDVARACARARARKVDWLRRAEHRYRYVSWDEAVGDDTEGLTWADVVPAPSDAGHHVSLESLPERIKAIAAKILAGVPLTATERKACQRFRQARISHVFGR